MDREKELAKKKYVLAELEVAKSGETVTSCYTGCTNGLGHRITEMIPNRLLTPSEHAVELLDEVRSQASEIELKSREYKQICSIADNLSTEKAKQQSEIDRLNRIMPHTGATCKWRCPRTGFCGTSVKSCRASFECINGKWEVKD